MNWKNRLKNYNFWISMFSAILLILQALKIEFDVAYVNEIFTAVLGLLVVVGIIIDPTKTVVSKDETKPKAEIKNEAIKDENVVAVIENQEQNSEPEVEEKTTLPFDKENEVNNINNENDFQTILNKISTSLEHKLNELSSKFQVSERELVDFQVCDNKLDEGGINPAAADMENPYIDLMK